MLIKNSPTYLNLFLNYFLTFLTVKIVILGKVLCELYYDHKNNHCCTIADKNHCFCAI